MVVYSHTGILYIIFAFSVSLTHAHTHTQHTKEKMWILHSLGSPSSLGVLIWLTIWVSLPVSLSPSRQENCLLSLISSVII